MSKPYTPLKVSAPVRRCPVRSTDKKRLDKKRTDLGKGLTHSESLSPNPYYADHSDWTTQRQVWHHLTAGLRMLSDNDFGRPWPDPVRPTILALLAQFDDDHCLQAAKEAREIVQRYDRAPNITALFEKKLRELAEVRAAVRGALA